jgi:hypothetical protein
MKKNTLIVIALIIGLQAYAQIDVKNINHVPMHNPSVVTDIYTPSAMGGDDVLWSEDFSDSTTPNIVTEDIAGYGDWHWGEESPGGMWSENAGVIQSETADNGFMIMESDFYNSHPQNDIIIDEVGENPIQAQFTIGPIDLSASDTEELVLQFYSNYRICCFYSPSDANDLNVYISTDGGETFNDLNYIEGDTYEVNVEQETFSQIPLGDFAPNTTNVYFRFEWIGTHYFWMIDDLSVIQRPAYDLKMESSWLTMENPEYIEYYSIPQSQMPDEMLIGAEVYNYGYNDDGAITLTGSITSTSAGANIEYELVESDSTALVETDYFDVSMLTVGSYTFTAEVTSSGDESTPEDNSLSRDFEISENVYSIDGLYDSFEWMGTGWPGGDDTADGVRYANFFDIKQYATLSSITVYLDGNEHPTSLGTFETQAGGEIIAYVCDTTGIFDPLVTTLEPDFGGAIWTSDFYLVTEDDVANEMVVIDVPELDLNPDAYYIVIEMYSNGLESDILIQDDTSIPQPWFASLVFYPSDQTWYSNPNAASIHLGLNGFENSLSENRLNGITCFPNPTRDHIEITSKNILYGNCSLNIYNMLGTLVLSKNYTHFGSEQYVNLEKLSAGSYIIEFENNEATNRQKLIIE